MDSTNSARVIGLCALLILTVLVIPSCGEEQRPITSGPSPTIKSVNRPPTLTPTPFGLVPCEEGMVVPKRTGCWVPHRLWFGSTWAERDLIFRVDQLGRGTLNDSLEPRFNLGPTHESIIRSVRQWKDAAEELRAVIIWAEPNEHGSWTVRKLWQFVETNGHVYFVATVTPTAPSYPQFGGTLRSRLPDCSGQSPFRFHAGLRDRCGLLSHLRDSTGLELALGGDAQGSKELGTQPRRVDLHLPP